MCLSRHSSEVPHAKPFEAKALVVLDRFVPPRAALQSFAKACGVTRDLTLQMSARHVGQDRVGALARRSSCMLSSTF